MPSPAISAMGSIPSSRRRVSGGGGTPGAIPNDPAGIQARMADAFVDTIGVNVHVNNSKYSAAWTSIVRPKLLASGMRHVREGIQPGSSNVINRLRDLYDAGGIKTLMLTNASNVTVDQAYSFVVDSVGVQRTSAIEGTNEPDLNGQVSITRNYSIDTFNKFRNASATASLPIVGPSVLNRTNATTIGDISAYMENGNVHKYYGGRNPETNGWGSNLNGYNYGSLDYDWNNVAEVTCGTDPVQSTECGWHNSIDQLYPHRGTPEGVEGKYLPRMYLFHWNKGVIRTFSYEFYDQNTGEANPERNFGMIRTDGGEKPGYIALKNMITVLNDKGTAFSPGKLNYTLSGSTANVHSTLLQKRDGKFYLALWLGVQEYNPDTQVENPAGNQTVTVTVPTIATAEVCTINTGTSFSSVSISGGSFTVAVNGHAKILRLTHV